MKFYLSEVRNRKNMSIKNLADVSGVAKSHIERIEAGKADPTIDIMCKLAKALDALVHDLFSCE